MTFLNLFSSRADAVSRARAGTAEADAGDRGITLLVVLLLGLVFAPVIGVHVAAVLLESPTASAPDSFAHGAASSGKPAPGAS